MDNNNPPPPIVDQPVIPPVASAPMPTTPPLPPPHKSKMLIMIISALLLLTIGLLAGYMLKGNTQTPSQNTTQITQAPPTQMPSPTPNETANWITYTALTGVTIKYPALLYPSSSSTGVDFFFGKFDSQGPGAIERIGLYKRTADYTKEFDALYNAPVGADVVEAQHAADVKVTKLRNFKIQTYDAVEYINDGTIPSTSGLGRGPVGYTHIITVRKNNDEYYYFLNSSMQKTLTEQHDSIFNTMFSSLNFRDWKSYTIKDANLTFSAPAELTVTSETQKVLETGKAYSLTLYVQKGTAGKPDYYQLYGLYQWEGTYSSESLQALKTDLEPTSVKDITIAGFPAIEGQVKGERNRFVTHILTDKGMFSLFTAEPTSENKKLTDQILATFRFTN